MENQVYLIIGVLIAGFAAVIYFIRQKPKDDDALKVMTEWMKEIKAGTESTRESMQKSIDLTNRAIGERLDNAGKVIGALTKELGGMQEIGRSMKDVQDLLKGPKLRGGMGEESLEMLIKQVLPSQHFTTQYRFQSGEVVDCIIRINKELLCIDSKFPLENFRAMVKSEKEEDQLVFRKAFFKDVKKHVDAIAKKYILPHEGTMDFALMYVPMESIFQEIVNEQEVQDYARSRKVLITSPNSFYHYLTIINNSLKGSQINEMAKQLQRIIAAIKQESDKFGGNLAVLTKHVTNAKNTTDSINEDFRKLASKIESAHGLQVSETSKVEELPEKLL
ncbi:MAG: DNA recombination protein RmuC [Candidatus Doudnabacteria bacterium]|nr:DNA recombination protein RmuC [Candidatus Doudnabacteria bacterium]